MAMLVGEVFPIYSRNKTPQARYGNLHPSWTPHNCYKCKGEESWVSIVVTSDDEWRSLANCMGGNLAYDPRFADGFLRMKNRRELDSLISQWTKERTPQAVSDSLQCVGVAAAP